MNKRALSALALAAALGTAGAPALAQNFTGFYVGGFVSTTSPLSMGDTGIKPPDIGFDIDATSLVSAMNGGLGSTSFGGQIGYTFDVGGFLVGGEVAVESWGSMGVKPKATTRPEPAFSNLTFSASAVFGYQVSDMFMLFGKAGVGGSPNPFAVVNGQGPSASSMFFTGGVGGEFGLGNGLSIRASYDFKVGGGYMGPLSAGVSEVISGPVFGGPTLGTATIGLVFRP